MTSEDPASWRRTAKVRGPKRVAGFSVRLLPGNDKLQGELMRASH